MISSFADWFATHIAYKKHLTIQQKAMLGYNLEILINKLVVYILLFSTALFISLSFLLHTLVFIGVFTILRKRTGGYHASKNWLCILESLFLCYVSVYFASSISSFLTVLFIIFLTFAVSVVTVFKYAPVNHPNLHLASDEIVALSKKARRCIVGLNLIILVLIFTPVPTSYPLAASIALFAAAVFIIIGKNNDKEGNHGRKQKEVRRKDS